MEFRRAYIAFQFLEAETPSFPPCKKNNNDQWRTNPRPHKQKKGVATHAFLTMRMINPQTFLTWYPGIIKSPHNPPSVARPLGNSTTKDAPFAAPDVWAIPWKKN